MTQARRDYFCSSIAAEQLFEPQVGVPWNGPPAVASASSGTRCLTLSMLLHLGSLGST